MKQFLILIVFSLILGCSSSDSDSTSEMELVEENMEVFMVLNGDFVDGAHPTSGKAMINAEHTKLELTNFKTDAGPLLEFYLATDVDGVTYVSLGELQGVEGNFTYTVPKGVNYETYKYLLVWCVDFKVSFGHAVLE